MTNGEKMQEVFPEGKTRRCRGGVVFESDGWCHAYDSDWWDAEYKEPTTKNCFGCKYSKDNHNAGTEECHLCMWKNQYTPTTDNDLADKEHKGEVMDFPNTFDEFANEYGFKDKEEVYTNGSELIQVFRVKQWLEHISTTKNNLEVEKAIEIIKADSIASYSVNEILLARDLAVEALKQMATTKNDLGVDCISRQATINAVKRIHPVDTDYDCTLYDKVDVMYVLDEMPPVTLQPCEDAISRQAAFEAFGLSEKTRKYGGDHSGYDTLMKYEIQDILEDLPPITPQPRKGHWIDEGFYAEGHSEHSFYCSKCEGHYIGYAGDFKWCPYCGSDNREVEE